MKKKFIGFLAAMMVTVSFGTVASAAEKVITVQVNATKVVFPDGKPVLDGSRVLIPVRFVSEALGAKVDYKDKTVLIQQGENKISMKIDSSIVNRGSERILLDVPAKVKSNRTYVPLRFVSEALGASVDWNSAKSLVSITTGTNVPQPPKANDSVFAPFQFGEQTDLAKSLFKNNMKVANGTLTFTLPEDAGATYKGKKLKPGEKYSFPLGEGGITITKEYVKENTIEGYNIYMDMNHRSLRGEYQDLKNDVVVLYTLIQNNKMIGTAGTLTEVVDIADSL
ncbi:copper amine oxidase N-terminal domain-containing protein [Paenibacillus enshidis]|uniref:Copper amine oxidase N-terminal domain-containing protein n=1 Tax=Paenibacillus enshidis TaxID=1458439 RepID=A0ABV5AW76_9BACL